MSFIFLVCLDPPAPQVIETNEGLNFSNIFNVFHKETSPFSVLGDKIQMKQKFWILEYSCLELVRNK